MCIFEINVFYGHSFAYLVMDGKLISVAEKESCHRMKY